MDYGQKLDSLLNHLIDEVGAILGRDIAAAARLIHGNPTFVGIRTQCTHIEQNPAGSIRLVLGAAAFSDVMYLVWESMFADEKADISELEVAFRLLKPSLYRIIWKEGYGKFEYIANAGEVGALLDHWRTDSTWFGGREEYGAVVRPFSFYAIAASILATSPRIYRTYKKCLLLIAKLVLEAGGMDSDEQAFYDNLVEQLETTEERLLAHIGNLNVGDASKADSTTGGATPAVRVVAPCDALQEGLGELQGLVGVHAVKAEVGRLTNFLKIRQQRLQQGMAIPKQSLHFVFTGNPGTGKTTVARIVAKVLYGFEVLKTPGLLEADRSSLVGGFIGQTAIKTNEAIEKATDGVLFIDEAYTLSRSDKEDYGQEAIDTLLKKMEDLRDRLVVIVAGYPNEMATFVSSNPGLESRFTRYINFDDYQVAELCQIFENMCKSNDYKLTQEARGNLAIILNRAFVNRDENFGNARFVRNAYERTLGNHSDRLALSDAELSRDALQTIEAADLPYGLADGIDGPFNLQASRWAVQCPGCGKLSSVPVQLIGEFVKCKCGSRFRSPWWNLDSKTVPGLVGFKKFERASDLVGY
jgi:hypothetical protein